MAETPTSIRIPAPLRARLLKVARKSNTPVSDIILTGLARFLSENKTPASVIEAVIRQRQEEVRAA